MCASQRTAPKCHPVLGWGRALLLALTIAVSSVPLWAQKALPPGVPAQPTGFVTDLAGVLTPAERTALERDLRRFRDSTSNELALLIAPRLPEGQVLEEYTNAVARAWGIGGKSNSNGVLIAVLMAERRARIEVGYGLEPVITDARAGRIIREQLSPAFRQGQYAAGIQAAVAQLERLARAEVNTPVRRKTSRFTRQDWIIAAVVLTLLLAFVLMAWFNDRRPYHGPLRDGERRRDGYGDYGGGWFFWGGHYSGGGGSDWGSSSSDSGSDFGGFSGGDFGGGGASGDW